MRFHQRLRRRWWIANRLIKNRVDKSPQAKSPLVKKSNLRIKHSHKHATLQSAHSTGTIQHNMVNPDKRNRERYQQHIEIIVIFSYIFNSIIHEILEWLSISGRTEDLKIYRISVEPQARLSILLTTLCFHSICGSSSMSGPLALWISLSFEPTEEE